MNDPIEAPAVRIELDSGELVEVAGAAVRLTMPAARAHGLAHLLDEWSGAVRPVSGAAVVESSRALARVLEDGAAALGDVEAARCAARLGASVPSRHRLAALGVLAGQDEPSLSLVQRLAAVDATVGGRPNRDEGGPGVPSAADRHRVAGSASGPVAGAGHGSRPILRCAIPVVNGASAARARPGAHRRLRELGGGLA